MSQIIIFAIPVFIALTLLEYGYGVLVHRNTYRLNDTLSSLSQGLLSQAVAACTPFFQIGLYSGIYHHVYHAENLTFWSSGYGIALAIVLYDFCDYWLHRTSHESNLFWAAHVVHHQSQHFNFSTALRQESFYPILGSVFFIPLALLGIPPESYATAGIAVLLYQFWVHTEHIGKLGWFDRVFTSPSNHRVHHATNARYIDKNYGAIFIVWDRLFGTFEPEQEACIYGTLKPLNSWNPLQAIGSVFMDMLGNMARAGSWRDRVRFVYKSPGWAPAADPAAAAVLPASPHTLYDPPVSKTRSLTAVLYFMFAALVALVLMWQEESLGLVQKIGLAISITVFLWLAGKMLSPRKAPATSD